ncbi:MAG TPA: DUF4386 domain-containing protein [Anaerolineales bacterium]|nr:DUF4386 domain-containing protein [Anaerolineales bacterium]
MSRTKLSSALGLAFIVQFVTSFGNGVFIGNTLFVDGDIVATMQNIGQNLGLMRANIFIDLLTSLGVIFLGGMLYLALRRQDERLALSGLAFYILEGALLAASRGDAFKLLQISQEYLAEASSTLEALARLSFESMNFVGSLLHMVAFSAGAVVFYSLLVNSQLVPRWLSLWGLISLLPLAVGSVSSIFGLELPFVLFVPYVPFELFIGVWLLVRGIPDEAAAA